MVNSTESKVHLWRAYCGCLVLCPSAPSPAELHWEGHAWTLGKKKKKEKTGIITEECQAKQEIIFN